MEQSILLTGATGYVGGRLRKRLEESGHQIRCLTRRPEALQAKVGPQTEVVEGDVLDAKSLERAFKGVDTAYYLVHSMGATGDFEEQDRKAAQNFVEAAKAAGVRRLIYLGGLAEEESRLSAHMRSRIEVGRILRESGVATVEFRASIVIGSDSLSFELIRALVERLPAMITPRWVSVPAQPISINDLLCYLVEALKLEGEENFVFEIGGADQVSYGDIMNEYARQRGLRRLMIPVPFLTPHLSSLWLGLVTPVYARIGRKLVDSMRNPSIVHDPQALDKFGVQPCGIQDAIRDAMLNEDQSIAESRWSDALSSSGDVPRWGGVRFGNRFVDSRTLVVDTSVEEAFAPIRSIGGERGWYFANWLWKLRGFIDLLAGGVGTRRGRASPDEISVGDTLDWWRVEAYEPNRLLRLKAEMKLPGRAWLEFEVTHCDSGTVIRQTAEFDPLGLFGQLYWYLLVPVHELVFRGMLRAIAKGGVRR